MQWREPNFDLIELAKLRWTEGLTIDALAKHYGKSWNAIQLQCAVAVKKGLRPDW